MKRTGISYKIISAVIYATFVLLMCLVISRKENLHVDGFFSYGLSNQIYTDHIGLAPLEGKVYMHGRSILPFRKALALIMVMSGKIRRKMYIPLCTMAFCIPFVPSFQIGSVSGSRHQ